MKKNIPNDKCTWNPKFYEVSMLFHQLLPALQAVWARADGFLNSTSNSQSDAPGDVNRSAAFPCHQALNAAFAKSPMGFVGSGCGVPLRCADQVVLSNRGQKNRICPSGVEANYQLRLFLAGEIMTRLENWHDFFNALCHISFPRLKAVINARQFYAMDAQIQNLPWPTRPGKNRNAEQDALTHFDEGGVVVAVKNSHMLHDLQGRNWKSAFWEKRLSMQHEVRFFVVGHAIYEDVLHGHPTPHGLAMGVVVEENFFGQTQHEQLKIIDTLAARQLANNVRYASTRDFFPLPVLGYPGWCQENSALSYYDNPQYFR